MSILAGGRHMLNHVVSLEGVELVELLEGLRCDGYAPHHAEVIALRDGICSALDRRGECPDELKRFVRTDDAREVVE